MRQLLLGRRLEGGDAHALRVDLADDVPHRPALAGGVHALQDEQQAARAAGAPLGVAAAPGGRPAAGRAWPAPSCRRLAAVEAGRRRRCRSAARSTGPAGSRSRSLTRSTRGRAALRVLRRGLGHGGDRRRGAVGSARRGRVGSLAVTLLQVWAPARSVGPCAGRRRTACRSRPPTAGWWRADVPAAVPRHRLRLPARRRHRAAARPAHALAAARRARPVPGLRPRPVRLDRRRLARGGAAGVGGLRAAHRHVHPGRHARRRGRAPRPPGRARRRPRRADAGRRLPRAGTAGGTTACTRTPCTSRTAARTRSSASSTPATQRGLGVCLDVVYNHLGPSGNYLPRFGPYFSDKHHTPWGSGGQPRRRGCRRGAPLGHRQRPRLAARLPRRRAAAGRRARAGRRLAGAPAGRAGPRGRRAVLRGTPAAVADRGVRPQPAGDRAPRSRPAASA